LLALEIIATNKFILHAPLQDLLFLLRCTKYQYSAASIGHSEKIVSRIAHPRMLSCDQNAMAIERY
jgi:hypothetical protein